MNTLRLSLVQIPFYWEDPTANIQLLSEVLKPVQETDLIILPEMWSTGFSMNTSKLAETMDGFTVQQMLSLANSKNAAVAGSVMIRHHENYYNRFIFARPDGTIDYYDKKHCFGLAKEDLFFTPGSTRTMIEWMGWRIFPQICYDLRFPVWSRNDLNYDLLIYVAQFPEKRRIAWSSLLAARAIENVSYAVGVNGIGKDGNDISYSGDSSVIDFEGQALLKMNSEHSVSTVVLDKEKLIAFRRAYPFLKDRDNFNIS